MAENPFLLPPGSSPAATPQPTIVTQATPPSRDPDRYIALPPSIESATHRIARPETAPTALQVHAGPVAADTAAVTAEQAPTHFSLVLPDGDRVAVDGPIVLGRDPAPPADRGDARPVTLDDPGKTVSKTHALVEPVQSEAASGLRVTELHSTNGVAITADGTRVVLVPGGAGWAPLGSVIELGSLTVLVAAG